MTVWPFLPVWPFLLIASTICGVWNLRAGIAFAAAILSVRATIYLGLNDPLILRMVIYSGMAFVVLFFVDRIAGGFFALIGITLVLAMLGHMEVRTHVLMSEAVLLLGMVVSGINGPSSGILNPVHHHRPDHSFDMAPQHSAADYQSDNL